MQLEIQIEIHNIEIQNRIPKLIYLDMVSKNVNTLLLDMPAQFGLLINALSIGGWISTLSLLYHLQLLLFSILLCLMSDTFTCLGSILSQ